MNSRRISEPNTAASRPTTALDFGIYRSPSPVDGLCLTCAYSVQRGDDERQCDNNGASRPICHCVYAMAAVTRRQDNISVDPPTPPDEHRRHSAGRPPRAVSIPCDLPQYGEEDPTDVNGDDWRRRVRRARNYEGDPSIDRVGSVHDADTARLMAMTKRRSGRHIPASPISNGSASYDGLLITRMRSRRSIIERDWNSLSQDIASVDYDRQPTGSDDLLVSLQQYSTGRQKKVRLHRHYTCLHVRDNFIYPITAAICSHDSPFIRRHNGSFAIIYNIIYYNG